MNIIRLAVATIAAIVLTHVQPALALEQILDYAIEIDIQADASIDVTEHITVKAEGNQIRRGIFRDFPTRYRDRVGNNVVVGLDVLSVERDGRPEPWFTENLSNGVRINTGNDDFLRVPGEYRYTLRYRTTRQLGFFATHDELYWNAIGTGWDFAIARAAVEVRLPQAVAIEKMQAEGYTGPQGAQGQAYTARITSPGVAQWVLTQALQPREGLTIVLSFPKGLVAEPDTRQRIVWLLLDNRGILVALAGLVVLLTYCVRRWRQVGRDPAPGVIIARYEPPEGRSPAELRYLRRGGYDMRCFTSDLLTSAVAGSVVIEREDRLLHKDRWRLERTGASDGSPLPTASALLSSLFSGGHARIELTQESAPQLMAARKAHVQALDSRLKGSHFNRNSNSAAIAFGIAVASAALALLVSGGAGVSAIIPICMLMLIVVLIFRKHIKAPTPEGRRLIDEAEGLKLYLSVAERDELKSLAGPGNPPQLDAARYESLLPYAIALDVEDAWTNKFTAAVGVAAAAAVTAGIAWYRGGGVNNLGGLASAIGNGLNASIASAATPPGSSSGGGGGGSSGGGGGGGGGGGR